jgi:VanZ family protein
LAGVSVPLAAVLAGAVGLVDEFAVQARVPERHADPWDALADVIGGTLGAATVAWLLARRRAQGARQRAARIRQRADRARQRPRRTGAR